MRGSTFVRKEEEAGNSKEARTNLSCLVFLLWSTLAVLQSRVQSVLYPTCTNHRNHQFVAYSSR